MSASGLGKSCSEGNSARLEPLLLPPPDRRFRFPGRKTLDYAKILMGILFVLKTGIA